MRKVLLTITLAMWGSLPAHAQTGAWADKLFNNSTIHDFGTVARGAQLYHRFPMTNIWAVPIEIMGKPRASCGCVDAKAVPMVLQPRESGYLEVTMDGHRFSGLKTVSIYVTIGPQFTSTATLQVIANSRMDVVFNPGEINFGVVPSGQTPTQEVDVEYAGEADWKVDDVATNGAPVDVSIKPLYNQPGRVGYRIRTTLKANALPGAIKKELILTTNDPTNPKVPLLVEATIQDSLSVSPNTVNFGSVKVGDQAEQRIVVRASQPFKVTAIQGLTNGIDVDLPADSQKTHIIRVKYQPQQAGALLKQLKIKTDLPNQPAASFTIEANASP